MVRIRDDLERLGLPGYYKCQYGTKLITMKWKDSGVVVHVFPLIPGIDVDSGPGTARYSYGTNGSNMAYSSFHTDMMQYLTDALASPEEEVENIEDSEENFE